MQSLYAAASGLSSQQKRLDILAANVANASTAGYKSTRTEFKDALYIAMDDPAQVNSAQNNLQAGSGVILESTEINLSPGTIVQTGNLYDFAIVGEGFFSVQNENGQTLYTRSGAFNTAEIDGKSYLVTAQGYFVLDQDGKRIELPSGQSVLQIGDNGVIQNADGTNSTVKIGMFQFDNPEGLAPSDGTCFSATAVSGQPRAVTEMHIVQGSLENSNVDLAQELTLLIRAQRAYSMASRALTTSDDMLGLANSMHG